MDPSQRWSEQRANEWYSAQPWLVGCNFIPSTAINQLEMWQADTFDLPAIERELDWARGLGFNTVRVFLHYLLWEAEAAPFTSRISTFLSIAASKGIRTLFVLFDDCWHDNARLGPQPAPVPGRHNSGWLQSPGHAVIAAGTALPRLEAYVKGVVSAFAQDPRILGWDLYNEVGNGFLIGQALPREQREAAYAEALKERAARLPRHMELLQLAFEWARAAAPDQPLTAGVWTGDRKLNELLTSNSDIISFHSYANDERLVELIGRLRRHARPILCTEFMARTLGSDFRAQLPIFKRERVGCYNWGLVNGKTQTHIAWTGESHVWFHDILRADGSPYDPEEVAFIRGMTRGNA
jgi:hypothetical protein